MSPSEFVIAAVVPNQLHAVLGVGDTVNVEVEADGPINIRNTRGAITRLERKAPTWANPYSYPERCGLKIVAELEENLSYAFDMLVVWEDLKTRELFYGEDSGCSCPTPFEDFKREDLIAIKSLDDIKGPAEDIDVPFAEKLTFYGKVREALRV